MNYLAASIAPRSLVKSYQCCTGLGVRGRESRFIQGVVAHGVGQRGSMSLLRTSVLRFPA